MSKINTLRKQNAYKLHVCKNLIYFRSGFVRKRKLGQDVFRIYFKEA